tara:strand:- start:514 stop:762 length:249 start_codon:yes stop_codon:yes gene_type:complete
MNDIIDNQLNEFGKEIRRRYIEKTKEETKDFSRDELVIKIADLQRCCDDMNTAYSCGEGYHYIGMSDDDVEELEKELEKKND